jgi:hypothetical protein
VGSERRRGGEDRHHLRISQGNRRRHAAEFRAAGVPSAYAIWRP